MSRQDEQLRQALRGYAARITQTHSVPEASVVWLRAERRRRRIAIERAERPLRIMQMVGLVCAALAAAWWLVRSDSLRSVPEIGTTGVMLALAAAVMIVGGCWTMVVVGRRPLS
ncbi:MAG TPA: hypothetical protein VHX60_10130 [Acidobacteriaceae bacterium]|jgi:cytochrome bd-type quinol oxidase subunit 1|nr:hypothetical protein [Acidobacteriaceae bacterium]